MYVLEKKLKFSAGLEFSFALKVFFDKTVAPQ